MLLCALDFSFHPSAWQMVFMRCTQQFYIPFNIHSNMVSGSTFAKLPSSPFATVAIHFFFLPHFAVPFQKMLPPFSKVDLFLNIASTPATNNNFELPFLSPAYFYLSRHFNHLYAFHANAHTAQPGERAKGGGDGKIKMRKTIH